MWGEREDTGSRRHSADTLPTASRSVRDCERTALFFAFERLAPDVAADDVEVVLEHAFCARTRCCARHGDREQQQEKPVPVGEGRPSNGLLPPSAFTCSFDFFRSRSLRLDA